MNLVVVKNTQEYLEIISSLKSTNKNLWFRGMNNATHKLVPSIFREKKIIGLNNSGLHSNGKFYRKSDAVMKSDLAAIDTFITYYQQHYPEKCINFNLIDYLYIMQHYDIPTRLLDFSTNELIALYFSVSSSSGKDCLLNVDQEIEDFLSYDGQSDKGSSVHIVDPIYTNNNTSRFVNFNEEVLDINDINLDVLSQIRLPICIRTENSDLRIVNQNGVFMLFGIDYKSYDDYDILNANTTKIFIPNSCRFAIKEELKELYNISHSFIFPDIKGISLEIIEEIEEKYKLDCISVFGE